MNRVLEKISQVSDRLSVSQIDEAIAILRSKKNNESEYLPTSKVLEKVSQISDRLSVSQIDEVIDILKAKKNYKPSSLPENLSETEKSTAWWYDYKMINGHKYKYKRWREKIFIVKLGEFRVVTRSKYAGKA
ncbi:MAG: hypothetical protein F6K54_29875 [Okeania sp. SIO3B5]|uniref:hypothetical protein n=1 Tax=Okeania sp. SIO3B5 TaxID=2607811 RepID=UPI0014011747|nr:hypothetical protein [Okeania sp. SIO3B5]NEO56913.1 hypothetical protein [Okeania sp. SIO3B5]